LGRGDGSAGGFVLLVRFREIDVWGGGIEGGACGSGHGLGLGLSLRLLLLLTFGSFEGCALSGATNSTVGHDGKLQW
jgi:hypothetical protein